MTEQTIEEITSDLVEQYTAELGTWVRERIPLLLEDKQFAARTAGLMIAMNRKLAECAAAFGETHGLEAEQIHILVLQQFTKNHAMALQATKAMETIQ